MSRVDLDIPPGLFGDDTTFAAAGRWANCSNVRFHRDRPQVINGWESLMADTLTGVCRTVFAWTDNSAVLNIAFGTHSALQVNVGGSLYTITPSGLAAGAIDGTGGAGWGTGTYSTGEYSEPSSSDYFPRTWSLASWGANLLASPRAGTLYVWANDTTQLATVIANAPDNITAMLVAPNADQVFALGCNEESGGTFNPLCIRHSDVRDYTGWTTSASTTAAEYILTGGGRIVSGRVIGDRILVWTTTTLFLGTYVGSLEQPWRFDSVGQHCGLIGPNACVVVGQKAFWISPDKQFYAYSLGGEPISMNPPIHEDFEEHLAASQSDKIVASSNSEFSEVRWDYPDDRDGYENSRYVAVSTLDGTWYRGIMARTAMVDSGPQPSPIGTSYGGAAFYHERGDSADGSPFAWYIESADQYLDENYTMMVRSVWPDFRNQTGGVTVSLTCRFEPQGDEVTTSADPMAPGDRKADIRATGRLIKVKFEGNSAPTSCRIGKPVLDVVRAGMR